MNIKRLLRVVPLLFFLSLIGLNAQDIYVSSTGNDGTGDGSSGNPYLTIQKAIDEAATGNVIQVGDGTFTENLILNTPAVTLQSANQHGAIIVGTIFIGSDSSPDADNCVLDGFRFEPSPLTAVWAISVIKAAGVEILNNYVEGLGPNGLVDGIRCSHSSLTGGTLIDGNEFIDCDFAISVDGGPDDYIITNNLVDNARLGIGFGSESTIGGTVENNTVTNCSVKAGMEVFVGGATTINNNSFSGNDPAIIYHNDDLSILNAEFNWWGDASGPFHTTMNPTATGNEVPDDVDYSPWFGNDVGTSPMTFYTTDDIQDAIDAASSGDFINVMDGVYNLTTRVEIDKPLTLTGNIITPANVEVNAPLAGGGQHSENSVFMILSGDVTLQGFRIQGAHHTGVAQNAGIYVDDPRFVANPGLSNITITNNEVTDNCYGIFVHNIKNSTITENKVFSSKKYVGKESESGVGIVVYGLEQSANHTENLLIDNNEVYLNETEGIRINVHSKIGGVDWVSDLAITISNNTVYSNGSTIAGYDNYIGIKSSGYSYGVTVSDNEIYGHLGTTISPTSANAGMLIFASKGWEISNNNIYDNLNGIFFFYSTNLSGSGSHVIVENDIYDNVRGISIDDGDEAVANNNRIYQNNNDDFLGVPYEPFGVFNGGTVDFDARDNWWGPASGPYNATTNQTATGNAVTDYVIYSPWFGNDPDVPRDPEIPWTFYVNGTNPDGVQELMDDADVLDGDVIYVIGPGTFNSIIIDKEITLIGANGAILTNASPAITIAANNVTVDGFTFNFDSATDYAIDVDGDYSGIVVKNCNFFNTDGFGVNPGLGIDNDNGGPYYVLAYDNNDWGDPSGPTHASNPGGLGVTISDYVIYEWEGLLEPIHSITGISIEPTFVWGELKTGPAATIEYQLIVSVNSDLSAPLFDENVGTVLTFDTDETLTDFPLANNTKYYWQIIALDGNLDPIYESEINYFTTVSNINISLYNPGDGMNLYAYDPATFTWGISQAQGSLRYYLQIKASGIAPSISDWYTDVEAEIATPGSIDFFYDHQNNSYRNVNGLDGGTRYYWRVVAYYDDGTTPNAFDYEDRVVKYSTAFYFDTQGGAVKAYPSWPIGGPIYYLDPTFYWYTMQWEPGANYTVMYSTDNTVVGDSLVNGVTEVYAGSNTYVYIGMDLDPSTTYYWQVRTRYGDEYNYSSVAEFTTYDAPGLVPTAANPSYPTGGLEIYTTAPTFYWWIGAMNVDVNFTVELSTDGGGTWPITFGPTFDTYIQGGGLLPGQSYHWRIKSSKIGYPDVYSTTAEFSIAGGLGSSVVLSWPVGNPTVYSATPTLSWYVDGSILGWDSFIVRWQKGSNSGNWATTYDGSFTTSDIYETFYTFTSDLEYGETYYWAVALYDGVNSPAHGDYSFSSFTIAGNNASIIQTNPANNTIILTKSPSFYWYVTGSMLGVTHFRITYSDTELFNANVETVITTPTSGSVNSPLTAGSIYWWYVELSYDGAGGPWVNPSSTWKFTVDAGASAVMPLVGSPANGVTISSHSPTLSWYLPAQSQSALSYEVELANNPDFSNATKYDNISQLNSQVADLAEGEYYWKVRSKTTGSTSSYSNTGNFKVGDGVTSVDGEEEIPLSYSIEQNYPNPFNPTTTINYSLPEANFVTIKIYNMLGQEVKTLMNGEVKAGRHTVNWNGDNNYGSKVSSGTYIYSITAGEFMQAKKMILLK